jgi:DNA-binding transcriptional ArsR family regulator
MIEPTDEDDASAVDVFRALADPGRRALLDALFERDGQTLGELCRVLPGLTRFGVMKHLAVLAAAHLVVTEKVGREKRHYLNPIPIQVIHDRWISKYAQPFSRAMTGLRAQLESPNPDQSTPPQERTA